MTLLSGWPASSFSFVLFKLDVTFASNPASTEQISLRWMHIVAGFLWLGFLYFFVLAVAPTLKVLDPATRRQGVPGNCVPWALVAAVERPGRLAGGISLFHDSGED